MYVSMYALLLQCTSVLFLSLPPSGRLTFYDHFCVVPLFTIFTVIHFLFYTPSSFYYISFCNFFLPLVFCLFLPTKKFTILFLFDFTLYLLSATVSLAANDLVVRMRKSCFLLFCLVLLVLLCGCCCYAATLTKHLFQRS